MKIAGRTGGNMAEGEVKLRPEIEKLSIKLEKDPKSKVFAQLADAYRKSNMVDEAIEIAKRGLEIHPNYAAAHLVLGRCYLEKRIFSLAREELERAANLDPYNSVTLKVLADALFAQGAKEEAIRRYQQVVDMDPLNNEVTERLEELLPPQAAQEPGKGAPEPNIAGTSLSGTTLAGEHLSGTIEKMLAEKGWGAQVSPPASPEPVLESKAEAPEDVYKPGSGQAVEEPPLGSEGTFGVVEDLISEKGLEPPALTPPGEEASPRQPAPEPAAKMPIEIGSAEPPSPSEPLKAPLTGEETAGIVEELIADRNLGVPAISSTAPPAMIEQKPAETAPLAKVEEPQVPAKAKGFGATATLAELYEQQRFYDKALELYEQVLAENPETQALQDKVQELKGKIFRKDGEAKSAPSFEGAEPSAGLPKKEPTQEQAILLPQTEGPEALRKSEEQVSNVLPEEGKPKGEFKSFQEWLDSLIKSKPGS
jgi:tetratricopeptide (TPR) repeat protein